MNDKVNQSLRLFIAAPVPDTVKASLVSLQSGNGKVKWMDVNQIHITLYFLGNVPGAQLDKVQGILSEQISGIKKFPVTLHTVELKRSMVWIPVDDKEGKLQNIFQNLKKQFQKEEIGENKQREQLSPHIMIGKYREKVVPATEKTLTHARNAFKTSTFDIESINLYKSELNPDGAVHTLLKSFSLSDNGPQEPEKQDPYEPGSEAI